MCRISDWKDSPLALLAQIVQVGIDTTRNPISPFCPTWPSMSLQEDFIILEHDELENCWRFVTGVAALSFVELGINGEKGFMTPGASMASIHTPVPGFNPTIHDQVIHIIII